MSLDSIITGKIVYSLLQYFLIREKNYCYTKVQDLSNFKVMLASRERRKYLTNGVPKEK